MARPSTIELAKRQQDFKDLYNIDPTDFDSVFQTTLNGQIGNLYTLSSDIVSVIKYIRMKLGEPVLPVQLKNEQITMLLEEAYLQFSAEINTFVAQNNILDVYGHDKFTNLTEKTVHQSFDFFYDQSNAVSEQTGMGGFSEVKKAYISLVSQKQIYNLLEDSYEETSNTVLGQYFLQQGIKTPIQITKVYHDQPAGSNGFNNTLLTQNVINAFSGPSESGIYGASVYYQMFPNYNDVLWKQHSKQANQLRLSTYTFDVYGNSIAIYPVPRWEARMWFEFRVNNSSYENNDGNGDDFFNKGVGHLANFPVFEIPYELINSIGKNWIRKYCLGLAKELLGNIRNTYTSGVIMPTGDTITLNGDQLINDGKEEQTKLIDDLRLVLEKFDFSEVIRKRAEQLDASKQILANQPLQIYIG